MIKKAIKYLKRILLVAFILVLGYFLAALVLSIISTNPKKISCVTDNYIFISTNGVHLDIIIPANKLPAPFRQNLQLESSFNFVSFGWGDKGFYLDTPTWSDLKLSTALKATFLDSKTAMHVTKYRNQMGNWHPISICEDQKELLCKYIIDSFARNSDGQLIKILEPGYTNFDEFYEANGSYNLINTCNNWVNKGLKIAKIKTSVWSPFDKGILYHIEKQEPLVK